MEQASAPVGSGNIPDKASDDGDGDNGEGHFRRASREYMPAPEEYYLPATTYNAETSEAHATARAPESPTVPTYLLPATTYNPAEDGRDEKEKESKEDTEERDSFAIFAMGGRFQPPGPSTTPGNEGKGKSGGRRWRKDRGGTKG
jgi:hypothetical protein